jgi:hypothetical protein
MGPGDTVVCVNVGFMHEAWNGPGLLLLTLGDVYTIRDVYIIRDGKVDGVKLWEVTNDEDWYFHAKRFRPCRKTNIDNLTALTRELEDA